VTIGSARVEDLAIQLAKATGEDVETAVARAIEERLSRVGPPAKTTGQEAILAFFDAAVRSRVRDHRSPEDIIGFDEFGLPT
jgi:antitoxin VapB